MIKKFQLEIYDEEFTDEANRKAHYEKHIVKNKEFDVSELDYEKMADSLALTPVNHKTIFGYISKRHDREARHAKWDSESGLFIIYFWKHHTPKIITAFSKDRREFETEKYVEYFDEITDEDFLKNY